jgi:hypothetical protein
LTSAAPRLPRRLVRSGKTRTRRSPPQFRAMVGEASEGRVPPITVGSHPGWPPTLDDAKREALGWASPTPSPHRTIDGDCGDRLCSPTCVRGRVRLVRLLRSHRDVRRAHRRPSRRTADRGRGSSGGVRAERRPSGLPGVRGGVNHAGIARLRRRGQIVSITGPTFGHCHDPALESRSQTPPRAADSVGDQLCE